jgi:hypothetical protein
MFTTQGHQSEGRAKDSDGVRSHHQKLADHLSPGYIDDPTILLFRVSIRDFWAGGAHSKTTLIFRVAAPSEGVSKGRRVWIGNGAAGEIRTPDLVLRRHALYPSELQPRTCIYIMHFGLRASLCSSWHGPNLKGVGVA